MKIRPTVSSDLPTIADWILADDYHRGKTAAVFFLNGPAANMTVEDSKGPILFVRAELEPECLILHVQFAPNQKLRTSKAIVFFDKEIKERAVTSNVSEIRFETVHQPLIDFMARLGWGYDGRCAYYDLPIRVRPLKLEDREMFETWCAQDRVHTAAGITWADVTAPNSEAYVIYDKEGPIQIVRFQRALRVAIQFNLGAKDRNVETADYVTDWFKSVAKNAGMTEVIVKPGSSGASRLAERVGFTDFSGKVLGV